MPDKESLTVRWTENALLTSSLIKNYLIEHFTKKEVEKFYSRLTAFEEAVSVFPELYQETKNKKIRRAVLSKELSVFYRISGKEIEVLAVLDNRCDNSKWL